MPKLKDPELFRKMIPGFSLRQSKKLRSVSAAIVHYPDGDCQYDSLIRKKRNKSNKKSI